MENPFDLPFKPPEWIKEKEREKNRARRAKRLGREIGKHGGYRKGAGRPKTKTYTHEVKVSLTRIQAMLLEDMGGIDIGIQKLIGEHL
jgi:hypothetical protein